MASNIVPGTYQTYKAGTEKVLNWLYENAVECGHCLEQENVDIKTEEEGERRGGQNKKSKLTPKRKNGKGSKAKGSGKAKSKKKNMAADATTIFITVNEYISLAESIASFIPKVRVPLWVTNMIEQVIAGRKKSARWFARQTTSSAHEQAHESNISHQYFIEVLETIRNILISLQGSTTKPRTKKPETPEDPIEEITNIFEYLEMEPDTEHTMTEPGPAKESRCEKVNVKIEFLSYEDELWLIYCFFEDFNITRQHLKALWTSYKNGRVDLTTAALSTNIAFELFRRSEEELVKQLQLRLHRKDRKDPAMWDYELIQDLIYGATAECRGQDIDYRKSESHVYNHDMFDIADWTGLPVYLILSIFLDEIKRKRIEGNMPAAWKIQRKKVKAAMKNYPAPIAFDYKNVKFDSSTDLLNPDCKWDCDVSILLSTHLPEFVFLLHQTAGDLHAAYKVFGNDELTSGVLKMIVDNHIPTWLVLALQVQLDIQYILFDDITRPQAELMAAGLRSKNTLENHLAFIEDMNKTRDKPITDTAQQLIDGIDLLIIEDRLWRARGATLCEYDHPRVDESYLLLKSHPVLCGMLRLRIDLDVQMRGLNFANRWGWLIAILQLYNACLMEEVVKKSWKDLEAVIATDTAKKMFLGERPRNIHECLRRAMLGAGYSATSFAAEPRNRKFQWKSKDRGRLALRHSSIGGCNVGRNALSLESLEKLLATTATALRAHTVKSDNDKRSPDEGLETGLVQNRVENADPTTRSKTVGFSTIQLLKALESIMHQETFLHNVDYFSLSIRAYRLLKAVHTKIYDSITQDFGVEAAEDMRNDACLGFLPLQVFVILCGGKNVEIIMSGTHQKKI
ncbi:hypothetical protein GLAREA_09080 [Glarea lozoyensis ATCC 20868]|uniref:DUF6604 domain-containing protein n=1 Tax=Glarea lozoyensis (strain ATCC 20868 / MF5171) TaxID=1116229 RepID=S3DEU0_GLAL2|nr:uncharacterized protein GLAREA_09080 [Glarea lozoyensis ATCC 20868]EPE36917.1 hypothetical protein GLAREA_09080 [Glarea lozoyensis ATCC 20868]